MLCRRCGEEIPETVEKCLTCGRSAGPPNVRAAEREEQVRGLEERYGSAFDGARANGCDRILEEFSEAIKESSAVINVDIRFLHFFVTSAKSLYSNYEHGVAGHARKPAPFPQDSARRGVGSTLFGAYASEIIYAALSLTGFGPQSYGPYAMTLKDIAISERATVLENNSF